MKLLLICKFMKKNKNENSSFVTYRLVYYESNIFYIPRKNIYTIFLFSQIKFYVNNNLRK